MEHFHALHGSGIDEDKRMINAKSPWTLAHLNKSVLQGFYNNPEVPPSMKTKLKEAMMMKPGLKKKLKGGAIAGDAELMLMADEDILQMALDDAEADWMIARRNHLLNPANNPDPGPPPVPQAPPQPPHSPPPTPPQRPSPPSTPPRSGGGICEWLDSCFAPPRGRSTGNLGLDDLHDYKNTIQRNRRAAENIMRTGRASPNSSPRAVAPEPLPPGFATGALKAGGNLMGGLKGVSKASGFIRRLMWENKDKHKGTYKKPTWGLAANSKMNKPAEFKIKKLMTPAQGGENEEGNSYGASPFIRHHFMGESKPFSPGKADGKYGHESKGQKKARKDFKKKEKEPEEAPKEKSPTPPKEAPKEKPEQLAKHFGNVIEEKKPEFGVLPPLSSWYGKPDPGKAFTQAQKRTPEEKEEALKKQYIAMWDMYNGQVRQAQHEIDFAEELFSPQGEERRKGLSSQGLINEKKKGQLAENNRREAYKTRERVAKVLKDKGWVPERLRDAIGR